MHLFFMVLRLTLFSWCHCYYGKTWSIEELKRIPRQFPPQFQLPSQFQLGPIVPPLPPSQNQFKLNFNSLNQLQLGPIVPPLSSSQNRPQPNFHFPLFPPLPPLPPLFPPINFPINFPNPQNPSKATPPPEQFIPGSNGKIPPAFLPQGFQPPIQKTTVRPFFPFPFPFPIPFPFKTQKPTSKTTTTTPTTTITIPTTTITTSTTTLSTPTTTPTTTTTTPTTPTTTLMTPTTTLTTPTTTRTTPTTTPTAHTTLKTTITTLLTTSPTLTTASLFTSTTTPMTITTPTTTTPTTSIAPSIIPTTIFTSTSIPTSILITTQTHIITTCRPRTLPPAGPTQPPIQCTGDGCTFDTKKVRNQEIILRQHNIRRRAVAEASNMYQMFWNTEAATIAQKQVESCSTKKPGPVMSSKFECNFNTFTTDIGIPWAKVIRKWSDNEKESFTYGQESPGTEHYTQIIWAESYLIGCAFSKCATKYNYVCAYCPGGNIKGKLGEPYKKGNQCSACPCGECSNSLCLPPD